VTSVRAVLFDFGHTLVDFTRTEDAGDVRPDAVVERLAEVPAAIEEW